MSIPEPLFEKNIPEVVEEGMFANDFSGSSGSAEEDNNLVSMIDTSIRNNVIVDQEEQERDREEYQSVLGDLQLESPIAAPQAPTPPNTGQVTPQQVAGLFPNDPLSIEIARRRQSG